MAESFNFFSDRPVDYGARYHESGLAGFGSGIAGGMYKIADANQSEKDYKMKKDLEKQMTMDEEDRQRQKKLSDMWSERYPDQPLPLNKDGKLNETAIMGAVGKFDRTIAPLQKMTAEQNFATQTGLKSLGLTPGSGQNVELPKAASIPQFGAGATPAGVMDSPTPVSAVPNATVTPISDEQLLRQAQEAAKAKERSVQTAEALAQRRSDTDAAAKNDRLTGFRAAIGQDPSPEFLTPDGDLNAAGQKAVTAAKAKGNLTQTQRNAEYAVDQGIKAGTIKPEEREQAIAVASTQLMGRFPQFPQTERDTAVGNAKYLQSLDALDSQVQNSLASGEDNFGPLANRWKTAVGGIVPGNPYPKARAIDQVYKEAGATKAFGEGGKQLTQVEKELTFGQIGSPTDNDFPQRLATHRGRVENVIQLQLERLKASPHRYTPDGQAAIGQLEKALAHKTGGAESVGGAPSINDLVEKYRSKSK